jgi:hypothetical protein
MIATHLATASEVLALVARAHAEAPAALAAAFERAERDGGLYRGDVADLTYIASRADVAQGAYAQLETAPREELYRAAREALASLSR